MSFTLEERGDLLFMGFQVPEGVSQMTFGRKNVLEIQKELENIKKQSHLKAILFFSHVPSGFAAGADIEEFLKIREDSDQALEAVTGFQNLIETVAELPQKTIALIHKNCLGGGCEFALACDYRIGSEDSVLALPEVQLGILPAGGGCQRLPRLLGVDQALPLLLTGKRLKGPAAFKKGLLDLLVSDSKSLLSVGERFLTEPALRKKSKRPEGLKKKVLSTAMLPLVMKKAKQEALESTKGNYPAPFKILECVEVGLKEGLKSGLKKEVASFVELLQTKECASLLHVFFSSNQAKKHKVSESQEKKSQEQFLKPLEEKKVPLGVIGAGLMGRGIAQVFLEGGVRVLLIDQKPEVLQSALLEINRNLEKKVNRKQITPDQKSALLGRLTESTHIEDLKDCSLVVEAVFEKLELKHDILKKCQSVISKDFIFASNTSGLPIDDLAKPARSQELVGGMHFFSPVPQMPLVEIIEGSQTSDLTTQVLFQLTKLIKKQPVLVADSPGFFTTRILVMSLLEALLIFEEGGKMKDIDQAVESYGFPMGSLKLLDSIGWDTGVKICQHLKLSPQLAPHMPELPEFILKALEANPQRLGLKAGLGFYQYRAGSPKPVREDPVIQAFLPNGAKKSFSQEEIKRRIIGVFLNESARCLDEGVIKKTEIGDIAAIFGLGFPPFRGGPFFALQQEDWVQILEELAKEHGPRFQPSASLRKFKTL